MYEPKKPQPTREAPDVDDLIFEKDVPCSGR